MSYKLFLDDRRIAPEGWVQAWTYTEFRKILVERGRPETIAFDHDLGEERDSLGFLFDPQPDGTQAAMWVAMNPEILPPTFSVHTMNFSGRQRIIGWMEGAKSKLVFGPYNEGWNVK